MSSRGVAPGKDAYPPLVYHYAGTSIPDYAQVTLRRAGSFWPSDVYLLHSSDTNPMFEGVFSDDYRNWYSPSAFAKVLASTKMDSDFRDGFWLHAIERFFVLSQWLFKTGRKCFLHAELDVRLFDHHDIFERLDSNGQGVFMPRASLTQAGANWLYCNDPSALDLMVNEFGRRAGEGFEMELLARFMDDFPRRLHAVPSHAAIENPDSSEVEFPALELRDVGKIVDVHPLGTWMLGQDRRNIPRQPVFNHFYYEELGSEKLRDVRYRYSWRTKGLEVCHRGGKWYPLVALHVHSKVMRRAHSSLYLAIYAWLANKEFDFVVIPQRWGSYLWSMARRLRDSLYLNLRGELGIKD